LRQISGMTSAVSAHETLSNLSLELAKHYPPGTEGLVESVRGNLAVARSSQSSLSLGNTTSETKADRQDAGSPFHDVAEYRGDLNPRVATFNARVVIFNPQVATVDPPVVTRRSHVDDESLAQINQGQAFQ